MEIHDPTGRVWHVRRRLIQLPRWGGFGSAAGVSNGLESASFGDGLDSLVIGLLVVVALALTFVFVWPLVVLLAELVAAIVLLLVRFLLGRWTVVAETTGERRSWSVRGHGESRRFAAHLADLIRGGAVLPAGDRVESTSTPDDPDTPAGPNGNVRVIRG